MARTHRRVPMACILLPSTCYWLEYIETTACPLTCTQHLRLGLSADLLGFQQKFNNLLPHWCDAMKEMCTAGGGQEYYQVNLDMQGKACGGWRYDVEPDQVTGLFCLMLKRRYNIDSKDRTGNIIWARLNLTQSALSKYCRFVRYEPRIGADTMSGEVRTGAIN